MASAKKLSTPDWRKLSIDQPYYDSTKREYCIAVSTNIDYVTVAHTALSNNDQLKRTIKDQGIENLAKFYNKIDGIGDVASFARTVETELQQPGIANAVTNTLRIRDYYMDSRPCSRLKYLVCVEALYWDQVPQKPRNFLSPEPVLPVEEVVVYKLSELNDLLNSVADSLLEIAQNITTTRPGLNFVQESDRLRAVYPSVLDLLYKNGFTNEEISGLSIQFDFGRATLDEEPTLENCLMTDEIINIGVHERSLSPGFEELLISKLTFLNNAPIKYARTRKNLRNLKRLGKQKDCPESFGIWGRDDWWSPPASWYHTLDTTRDHAEGAYEFYEKHTSSRRGRQIIGGLRDRQVWPYNGRKKIKTREEYKAERGVPTEEDKRRIEKEKSKEFDFVGSVLFSAQKQNELDAEIQTATDAYEKLLGRFDMDYLERILLRLALDALGIEDINQLIFEKALEYLDHDDLWGKDGLVANCTPEFEDTLRDEIDPTPGCEDPNAAVKEKILELQGGGQISAEALQTCLQTVCPPATRMFGLKKQVEGLLAYATSDLIPYDRDELCPDPPNDEHPWEGIKFDRFEYDFPNLSNLADTTMALYEEFRKALLDTYDELIVGIIKQLLRMLIENIERILCNWTDMKSFGTALANATAAGELGAEIVEFAQEEIWINNIRAGMRSAISDWGLDPEGFFPTGNPADPRTYEQRLTDFVNEVYDCLNPGEFRAALKGVELGQNLQIVEMATKKNLSCINPGDMLAIMGSAGADLDIPGPQDGRLPRRPGESICDPAYANEVEQNFRDSYADRADENVIQQLWDKEVQKLKDTARELLSLLDSADLGCQDDLSPSFRDNDFNRNMQENASNTMLSPVTEAFLRNMSDWASDIFRERPSAIDFGENPPPNAEMIREFFEQDESIITFILGLLGNFSDSITLGVEEPCRPGGPEAWMSAVMVNGRALTMYPNCDLTEASSPKDFFLKRNRIAASGPMLEIPLPNGPLYDSLAADPRFNFFGFEHSSARQVSSEQYTFSNFLLGTLAKELSFASRGLLLDPAIGVVPQWLLEDVQKALYKDVLENSGKQFVEVMRGELFNFESGGRPRQDSNIYQLLSRIKNEPTQFNALLEIEQELRSISEEFEKNADRPSSERLSSPPLQDASVLPLIRILVRVAVVERLLNLLPVLPTIGFMTASRSSVFISSLIQSIQSSLLSHPYGPALESLGLNINSLLQSTEEMSLRDFIAQETTTALAKIGDILGGRDDFFQNLPTVSVPVKAGAEELFVGTEFVVDVGGPSQVDPEIALQFDFFNPDPYPYTDEIKNNIDFENYSDSGDLREIDEKEFFNFIPREYEPDTRDNEHGVRIDYPHVIEPSELQLKVNNTGNFVFEKYIEFEPLEEGEFNELANWFSPQNREALGYIRAAFEGLLVDSDMSRAQVESVEVFRSLFKRAVLNAFIQFNDFGKLAWMTAAAPDDRNHYGYNAETPFDWPAWEMTRDRRNIQLLRKLELDFFVVQSFDNQLEAQGRGQGSGFYGAFPMSDDLEFANDLFWGNLPLNNIFKNLKTGLRFSFVHTDVDNRDGELGLLSGLDEGLYARYIEYGEGERQFESGFPENPNVEWAKYCNIRKAYDTFLQEEGGEFGQRMRRALTVPMAEQAASIVDLTVANFYGKKGLRDPETRRRFTFDGTSPSQFVEPRGFATEDGRLDDLPPIAINVGNLAGLSDMAIHDFELKRQQMIHNNPIFKVFTNFAIPFDDIYAAIASHVGEEVASADFPVLEETKRNIMLMLYAMHPPSDADASTGIGDSHVVKQWLLEHFS